MDFLSYNDEGLLDLEQIQAIFENMANTLLLHKNTNVSKRILNESKSKIALWNICIF
ncbi:hypothetical protein [Helicobacter sp. UBA3407]|uniref:hypothetical protein n=1 Tax=Helicobacter TaxID=209 RepID=UPI00262BE9FC|nr:hypothetical protein [Helicobacter sp. UBA3407]